MEFVSQYAPWGLLSRAMIHGVLTILVRFALLATLQFLMIAMPVLLDLLEEFLWTLSSNFCTIEALAMTLVLACLGLVGVLKRSLLMTSEMIL